MSDIYIQGESLHVDNKVDRVKIEGINETFESLNPKILRVGEGGGGASALTDLTDVEISTPTSSQILKYDEQNDKWVNGDGFLAPAIYSTDEREVGVWTDGKPLYQKTIITTNTTVNSWQNVDISSLNIESVASMNGYWVRHSSIDTYLTYPFFALENDSNTYTGLFRIDPGDGGPDNSRLRYKITSDGTSKQVFTIQYTKTTDVAGSGTWTPSGIPAVHYDDNEKVIGTWFGETLYEKTLTATFASYNDTTVELLFTGLSLDKLIDAKGILIPSDNPDDTVVINKNSINGIIFSFANNEHIVVTRGGVGYWGATPTVKVTIQYTKTT